MFKIVEERTQEYVLTSWQSGTSQYKDYMLKLALDDRLAFRYMSIKSMDETIYCENTYEIKDVQDKIDNMDIKRIELYGNYLGGKLRIVHSDIDDNITVITSGSIDIDGLMINLDKQ